MKNGKCPSCDSTEIFASDFAPLQAGGSFLGLYNPNGNDLKLEVQVCASCSHIEIGVAESSKPKVAELVKSENWKKVSS